MPSRDALTREYRDLSEKLSKPKAIPPGAYAGVAARHAELRRILALFGEIDRLRAERADQETLCADADPAVRSLAQEELHNTAASLARAEDALRHAMLPQDPHAGKDVVMEIRAGTGGDEASLFARDLFQMYTRYASRRGWQTRLVSEHRSEASGYKEIIFEVVGADAYGTLRLESGVHRIQRIPATEKSNRIHTSTATVAVLPKALEVDVEVRPEDLRIDTFRAGGHGGQHVQKTDSAVRITHLPSGLVVQCQDERSQQKNKERAVSVLRSRLLAMKIEARATAEASARQAQIGTGDRSEKIRTYNIPQDRVTDHRIKETWHSIDRLMAGELDAIIAALRKAQEDALLAGTATDA